MERQHKGNDCYPTKQTKEVELKCAVLCLEEKIQCTL